MADHDRTRNEPESAFSFAVSELRRAKRTQQAALFGVDAASLKVVNEKPGFDPYNTSGSFDRKNNWSRIGKR